MSKTSDIIDMAAEQYPNIADIRQRIIRPKLIQLHSGLEGFDSPKMYGVYRHTGGEPLGVVGSRYYPLDLELLLASVITSITECGIELDLADLKYTEYKGGAKIAYSIPLPTVEFERSPMVGDIIKRSLEFRTGFDGLTKVSATEVYRRVWCDNGSSSPFEQSLSFKNTIGNQGLILNLCNSIVKSKEVGDKFLYDFGRLADVEVNQADMDDFFKKVAGFSQKEYKDISTKGRNILDAINRDVAIEMQNTGNNMFSLLNGITRYTTHDKSGGSEESLLYDSSKQLTHNAMKMAFATLN